MADISVQFLKAWRITTSGTTDEEYGTSAKISFVMRNKTSSSVSLTYTIKYKKTTESSYTTGTTGTETIPSMLGVVKNVYIYSVFETGSKYDILITLTDGTDTDTAAGFLRQGLRFLEMNPTDNSVGILTGLGGETDTLYLGRNIDVDGYPLSMTMMERDLTDLDDYLIPGQYHLTGGSSYDSATGTTTVTRHDNLPDAIPTNYNALLIVAASEDTGHVTQILTDYNDNLIYKRTILNGSAYDWVCGRRDPWQLDCGTISSLPTTISNDAITSDTLAIGAYFSEDRAIRSSQLRVITSNGSLTLGGTMVSGSTTTLTLILI